jgi:hypothetical protein
MLDYLSWLQWFSDLSDCSNLVDYRLFILALVVLRLVRLLKLGWLCRLLWQIKIVASAQSSVAVSCCRAMINEKQSQSILVSGETRAGKTEIDRDVFGIHGTSSCSWWTNSGTPSSWGLNHLKGQVGFSLISCPSTDNTGRVLQLDVNHIILPSQSSFRYFQVYYLVGSNHQITEQDVWIFNLHLQFTVWFIPSDCISFLIT